MQRFSRQTALQRLAGRQQMNLPDEARGLQRSLGRGQGFTGRGSWRKKISVHCYSRGSASKLPIVKYVDALRRFEEEIIGHQWRITQLWGQRQLDSLTTSVTNLHGDNLSGRPGQFYG